MHNASPYTCTKIQRNQMSSFVCTRINGQFLTYFHNQNSFTQNEWMIFLRLLRIYIQGASNYIQTFKYKVKILSRRRDGGGGLGLLLMFFWPILVVSEPVRFIHAVYILFIHHTHNQRWWSIPAQLKYCHKI